MQHSSDLGEYYSARATEYERVYQKPERQEDLARLRVRVPELLLGRTVLEIACGTGYWTEAIAGAARSVQAMDRSEEVLAIARRKELPEGRVSFRSADAMALPKDLGAFDAAFAGFWWSHIPKRHLGGFLEGLRSHLVPGALVVLLDNRYVEGSSTPVSRRSTDGDSYQVRRLADGREFEILKNFPDETELRNRLEPYAVNICYQELGHYWLLTCENAGQQSAKGSEPVTP